MTIKEIVKQYLTEHGYDGLYVPSECACKIDDLMPCGESHDNCEAGYFINGDCEDGYDFHIGSKK